MTDERQLPPNNPTEPWQNVTVEEQPRTIASRIFNVASVLAMAVLASACLLMVGVNIGQQRQLAADRAEIDAAYAERDATVIRASDLVQQLVAAQESMATSQADQAESLRLMRPVQNGKVGR